MFVSISALLFCQACSSISRPAFSFFKWHLHQSIQSATHSYSSFRGLLLLFKVPYICQPTRPPVIHALARTTAHEKVLYSGQGDDVRDRFDASATSLSNSMIRMPSKHHCLLLASRRST